MKNMKPQFILALVLAAVVALAGGVWYSNPELVEGLVAKEELHEESFEKQLTQRKEVIENEEERTPDLDPTEESPIVAEEHDLDDSPTIDDLEATLENLKEENRQKVEVKKEESKEEKAALEVSRAENQKQIQMLVEQMEKDASKRGVNKQAKSQQHTEEVVSQIEEKEKATSTAKKHAKKYVVIDESKEAQDVKAEIQPPLTEEKSKSAWIVLGAFKTEYFFQEMMKKAQEAGETPVAGSVKIKDQTFKSVKIGPMSVEEAEAKLQELKSKGFPQDAFIKK